VNFRGDQALAVLRGLFRPDPTAVSAFESAFAAALGVRHAIATSSGKAALALVMRGLEAAPDDEVLLASYNVPEVPAVLKGLGLRVRFADIAPRTFNLDPESAADAATRRTRFLLITHLYGHPADLDRLRELAERRGLSLIEDCAQAFGARWRGRAVGTCGRAGIFSLGLLKNLTTLRGGMVTTDDDALAARMRAMLGSSREASRILIARELLVGLAVTAATSHRVFSWLGYPAIRALEALTPTLVWRLARRKPGSWEQRPLDVALSAIGSAEANAGLLGLARVEQATRVRRAYAERLLERLRGIAGLDVQEALPHSEPAWTQFVVRVRSRERVRRRLLREGVDTTMGYLRACHRLPFAEPDQPPCAHSDALEAQNLYLPIFEDLDPHDIERLASAVRRAVQEG